MQRCRFADEAGAALLGLDAAPAIGGKKVTGTIAVALATAPTERSISAVRMTKVRADRDDRGDRNLLENVFKIAERGEARACNAEENDEAEKRDEGGDVAQLIAQEIAEAKGAGRTRFDARRVHYR